MGWVWSLPSHALCLLITIHDGEGLFFFHSPLPTPGRECNVGTSSQTLYRGIELSGRISVHYALPYPA